MSGKTLVRWLGLVLALMGFSAQAEPRFTLVFAGDTTLDGAIGRLIAQGKDPFVNVAPLFKNADLRLANLECVVSDRGSSEGKIYTFRANPRVLSTLQRHVDGVTLANNHSGDFGSEAFADMLARLKAHRLAYVGGGQNLAEAHRPWLIEHHGLRIALLSYNEFMPRSFEAGANTPGIAWSEDEQVIDDIQHARLEQKADLVITLMHWGWENEPVANPRQRALARTMIDAGADAVIGGHPHVTQDIEIYRGKPVVYSVGNFMMEATDNEAQRQGWVLRMVFDAQGAQAFQTQPIRLDKKGQPKPAPQTASPCWQRGEEAVHACQR